VTLILSVVATLACALFAGAAVYINLVEHPARLASGADVALKQWVPSYQRATVMQVTLALVATVGGVAMWFLDGSLLWLVGSLVIVDVIPFTLVVIFPTNNRLLEQGRDPRSAETRELLEKWGRLHVVRSGLGLIATVVYLIALAR
jgi:uncharacterized membrane protein